MNASHAYRRLVPALLVDWRFRPFRVAEAAAAGLAQPAGGRIDFLKRPQTVTLNTEPPAGPRVPHAEVRPQVNAGIILKRPTGERQ